MAVLRRSIILATAGLALLVGLWLAFIAKPGPGSALAEPAPPETDGAAPAEKSQNLRQLIDLDLARHRLGESVPIGEGIVTGHVESDRGQYLPNTKASHFEHVTFLPRSGPSKVSGHADGTASVAYGKGGIARGVTTVHCFATSDWLGQGYLRTGLPVPPAHEPVRVFSHSWISDAAGRAGEVLRRVDYVIDRDDVVMCAGVNNGRASQVPALLASAYNVIAVGTADGNGASSGGYTRVEGAGRCKPDIVGPRRRTSYATPAVAACAARLLEMGERMKDATPGAVRAETIKAVLLAGATKPWNWRPEPGKPLDEHLGAGIVNLDWSLRILEAGRAEPGATAGGLGWDFNDLDPGQTAAYELSTEETAPPAISVVLTWHRRIDGRVGNDLLTNRPRWLDDARLADYDLRLIYTDPAGRSGVIAESTSRIDNVEHVYVDAPPPGRYRVEVIRRDDGHAEAWDYAVAWRAVERDVTDE